MTNTASVETSSRPLPLCTQVILDLAAGRTVEALLKARVLASVPADAPQGTADSLFNSPTWNTSLEAMNAQYLLAQQQPLTLVDAGDVRPSLSAEQRARLELQSSDLASRVNQWFPAAAGETPGPTQVSVLKAPWQSHPAGSVVCIQESDFGRIGYIFLHLRYDIDALQVSVVTQAGHIFIANNPSAEPHTRLRTLVRHTMASGGNQFGKAFLTFATTAAFAIPSPWGVLLSGGLSVFQMFLGSAEPKNNALADSIASALQQSVTLMRAAITEEKIKDALATIEAETRWIANTFTAIKDLGDDRNGASSFVQDTLNKINGALGPENKLAIHFYAMKQEAENAKSSLDIRDQACEVMSTVAGLHLTYMRLRVQLKSWQHLDSADDTFYAWYDEFLDQTSGPDGYLTIVSKVFEALKQERLSAIDARVNQVGPVQRAEITLQPVFVKTLGGGAWVEPSVSDKQQAAQRSCWFFVDAGQAGEHRWNDTTIDHRDSCNVLTSFEDVQHRNQAEEARQAYVNKLRSDLTTPVNEKFATMIEAISKWKTNADSWSENKPPRTPTSAPTVSTKPEDWGAATPHGPNWVSGAKVRYAVAFKNSKGGTPPGPWTDWVPVTGRAWPLLINLPTDSVKTAKTRALHRQFEGKEDTVCAIIPDNSTTSYRDVND